MQNKSFFVVFLLFFVISSLLLSTDFLKGQSVFRAIPPTPNQVQGKPFLAFPSGDSLAYEGLFQTMDSLLIDGEETHLTIMHIGGSHIQAGIFSNRMRANLLTLSPGLVSARGLIFPFSAAKTNNPYNYSTTYTGNWIVAKNTQKEPCFVLGLTGMCIVPEDSSATITIFTKKNDSLSYNFNTIYVLGYSDSMWVKPQLRLRDSLLIEGVWNAKTMSYSFNLETDINTFTLQFAKNDTMWQPFYLRGFYLDNQRAGISYVDIGVNGASVLSYLKCELLENDLQLVHPDLCILSIGINDANCNDFDTSQFINNYKNLIAKIRRVSPNCQFLFTTNNDSYRRISRKYVNNPNGYLAQQAFYSLANYYKCGVFDLFAYMGGLKSISEWEKAGLAKKDKVHFTTEGYSIIGDLLYDALLNEYAKHLKQKRKQYESD